MLLERQIDTSVFQLISSLFADVEFINVTREYPTEEVVNPTIAVEFESLYVKPFELGNRLGMDFFMWSIDIWAKTRTQRDDLAYTIKNAIQQGILVYDYQTNEDFTTLPDSIGALSVEEIKIKPVKIYAQLSSKYNWRTTVTLTAFFNSSST